MMENPDTPPPDKVNLALGTRIRAQRIKHNMKISKLADITGLTSSTISQVERALISPSIATLKKLCDAMHIPISYLFEDADAADQEEAAERNGSSGAGPDLAAHLKMYASFNLMGLSPVVHKEERKILSPNPGVRFYLLNPNLAGPTELIYNEYDPGAGTGPGLYTHPGAECGLILSGELVVQIKDDIYTLKEGDSITFNSSDPHSKNNLSDVMCTCIWANTPPWF
ncbi:MAG: cupin domain-containing protein [Treponema sp.]|jgi:transcriptional regulator with XRE-family HTH domain|nr:cupin domain-containing protein [Treponema sp.]